MRHEVRGSLDLSPEETALLDNHTLLNLFNVLELQLAQLARNISDAGLKEYSQFCLEVLMGLSRTGLEGQLPAMEKNCARLRTHIENLLGQHPSEKELLSGLLETVSVGHARLQEFKGDRFTWKEIPKEQYRKNLFAFLRATESVSGKRFHFEYSPERPSGNAYWIDFQINVSEALIRSPVVLQDTIRDLVGNARKYSDPGSAIRIALETESVGGLRLKVSDEGIGIPEEEILKVVQYGYRATNVIDRRTMGGGFGLTKAYNLCRSCGGQFFIETELGKGTTIEMTLFPK